MAERGAQPQRLARASTSPKNPAYRDLAYVEPLMGPHTVAILAEKTYGALIDHGRIDDTATTGLDQAMQDLEELQANGIDDLRVTDELEEINLQKFGGSIDALQTGVSARQNQGSRGQTEQTLRSEAQRLRRLVIRMTNAAGSGHPTSCMSAADIVAALFFHTMRWDPRDAKARDVDSFILSKGHAVPLLWAALSEAGAIDDDPMTLRRIDSRLEGHPTPSQPWVKIATGSLGQGLSAANGIALANRLDGIDASIYCLMGDGECAEGSVWEAAEFASSNSCPAWSPSSTSMRWARAARRGNGTTPGAYARRFEAFGWNAVEIDGHDMGAILDVLERAGRTPGQAPTAIIAATIKGKGVSFLEGKEGWHGKPLDKDQMAAALAELGEDGPRATVEPRRLGLQTPPAAQAPKSITIDYPRDKPVATREAYGHALTKLGALRGDIVGIDGDTMNSTFAELFAKAYPQRFFEGYIAEQNMAGIGLGLAGQRQDALCRDLRLFPDARRGFHPHGGL
ncbi:MAG: transketolase [Aliidongia sp.]